MRRREFIGLLGGPWAWPGVVRAQEPAMPVVGFLRSTPSEPFLHLAAAFRLGLDQLGFIEGKNVVIEYRYANNDPARLPGLVAELIGRRVGVVVANGLGAQAAKAVGAPMPIVFVVGDDPVKLGLVKSLSQPDGNVTGVTFFAGSQLGAKRVEILHELTPNASLVAVLHDPTAAGSAAELSGVEAAARTLRRQTMVLKAAGEHDIDAAFANLVAARAGALLVISSPVFTSHRHRLVALAAQHALPAIYDLREFAAEGGLISYAASIAEAYRQAGIYAGRILKGTKASELPVVQPTRYSLVVNLRTAKALGLQIPATLLAQADEVIE